MRMQARGVGLFSVAVCAAVLAFGAVGRTRGDDTPATKDDKASKDDPAALRQQLVGEWKLNPELSEDPREKMRQARAEGGGSPGGGGGWGHGGGYGGGHGGYGGGRGGGYRGGGAEQQGGESGTARTPLMVFSSERITVTNIEPEVTMLDPDGEQRQLHADDQSYKDANGADVKARWDKSKLVVETKTGRGSMKETWSVGQDPRRLTVLVEIRRPYGGDVSVKRVFDPLAADSR
jgi:hypothetical protein